MSRKRRELTGEERDRLVQCAHSWIDVPYLIKGEGRDGIDCSHLVTQVFWEAMNVRYLPWSDWLFLYFDIIPQAKLRPGDIIFFRRRERKPRRLVAHVGIYVGDGHIIHASYRAKRVIKEPIGNLKKQGLFLIEVKDVPVAHQWLDELLERG